MGTNQDDPVSRPRCHTPFLAVTLSFTFASTFAFSTPLEVADFGTFVGVYLIFGVGVRGQFTIDKEGLVTHDGLFPLPAPITFKKLQNLSPQRDS